MNTPTDNQTTRLKALETRLTRERCKEIAVALGYSYPPATKPQAALLILALTADQRGECELLAGGGLKLARRERVKVGK